MNSNIIFTTNTAISVILLLDLENVESIEDNIV